jgi:hypothetical protein
LIYCLVRRIFASIERGRLLVFTLVEVLKMQFEKSFLYGRIF